MLHNRIMRKVFENFLAAAFREVTRDQDEVQLPLAAGQGFPAHNQSARTQHKREQSFHGFLRTRFLLWLLGHQRSMCPQSAAPESEECRGVTAGAVIRWLRSRCDRLAREAGVPEP